MKTGPTYEYAKGAGREQKLRPSSTTFNPTARKQPEDLRAIFTRVFFAASDFYEKLDQNIAI